MAEVEPEIPTAQPWGYLATAGWFALATLISMILFVGAVKSLDPAAMKLRFEDASLRLLPYSTTIFTGVQLAVLALAARLRHWRAKDYFGLVRPSNREIAIALASLIVVSTTEATVRYLVGWGTEYGIDLYARARAGGVLSLLWFVIGFAMVFPIAEEMIYRGFLYRGWVRAPRSVVPGVVFISALFAITHVQYDLFGIFIIFCRGLFYGWVRWWSGSTLLAALMHGVTNLWVIVVVYA